MAPTDLHPLLAAADLPLGAVIAAPVRDLSSVLVAALVAGALLLRAPAARWTP